MAPEILTIGHSTRSLEEFLAAAEDLLLRAGEVRKAVMCAEAHPSQCHRRLLAD